MVWSRIATISEVNGINRGFYKITGLFVFSIGPSEGA